MLAGLSLLDLTLCSTQGAASAKRRENADFQLSQENKVKNTKCGLAPLLTWGIKKPHLA